MVKTPDVDGDRGFLMVALLIAMAVVAIWMTAALPSWRQQAQREKEEELIFRGEQYAMAIALFQYKNNNVPPQDIDILVSQRFLRKKWKDPVTGCDFLPQGPGVITSALPRSSVPPFNFLVSFGALSLVGLITERWLVDLAVRQAYARGIGLRKAVIVGRHAEVQELIAALTEEANTRNAVFHDSGSK